MSGASSAAKQAGGLEPVETLHLYVQQDDREVFTQRMSQHLFPGLGFDQVEAHAVQTRFKCEQIRWKVVYKQYAGSRREANILLRSTQHVLPPPSNACTVTAN